MSTQALCGLGARVTGITGISEYSEWNIDLTVDAIDGTSMDNSNGWVERIPCLKGGTGNIVAFGTQPVLGTYTGCSFTDKTPAKQTIGGDIIIHEITESTPVADKVIWDCKFTFTGAITVTTV